MRDRILAASLLLVLASGCSGSGSSGVPASAVADSSVRSASQERVAASGANAVSNPGFESGSLSPWTSCGSTTHAAVTSAKSHSGSYSALLGATAKPEVNGTAAVCQTITVPADATLTFFVYEGTNDSIQYVDQEADVLSTSGTQLAQLYAEAKSTGGWVEKTFDMSAYAGETVQLYFGVKGNGYTSDYVYEYLDDVSLTAAGATAAPSATPSAAPTVSPSASPSTKPTASPTASATATPSATPTAQPSSSAFPCNDQQFLTDQTEFGNGTITADQFVQVCGSVTQVLPEKDTSSGHHGYFYVQMPSGYDIEIVSNLDAMAQASTDQPPTTWPWVSVGQYVYVQGRYYYDNSSSQGIDWTEDDTSSSWNHVGYVAVCTSSGTNCSKYW